MARRPGDDWGPATGVGVTATFGAVARAVATGQGLMADPFAEPLVRAVGLQYFVRLIDDMRFAADGGVHPVTTGLIDLLAAHTRFLDEFLADAGGAGIRQVVILASGLDARAYRLWWPPDTTIYEIDRPDVLEFKADVLRGLGAPLTAHRCAVGIDLRQDWLAALRRVGFEDTRPTAWIAEQLLVGYLPPDAQVRLVNRFTEASTAGSRFAADHMPTWTPEQLDAARDLVAEWRRHGVDVDLAGLTYPGEYGSVPDYLRARGWEVVERDALHLVTALGLPELWRGDADDVKAVPRYVTARRL